MIATQDMAGQRDSLRIRCWKETIKCGLPVCQRTFCLLFAKLLRRQEILFQGRDAKIHLARLVNCFKDANRISPTASLRAGPTKWSASRSMREVSGRPQ